MKKSTEAWLIVGGCLLTWLFVLPFTAGIIADIPTKQTLKTPWGSVNFTTPKCMNINFYRQRIDDPKSWQDHFGNENGYTDLLSASYEYGGAFGGMGDPLSRVLLDIHVKKLEGGNSSIKELETHLSNLPERRPNSTIGIRALNGFPAVVQYSEEGCGDFTKLKIISWPTSPEYYVNVRIWEETRKESTEKSLRIADKAFNMIADSIQFNSLEKLGDQSISQTTP